MPAFDLNATFKQAEDKMAGALRDLEHDFGTLRTGRAHPSLLDAVKVEVYGTLTPLKQLAAVTAPDSHTIMVSPWDKSSTKAIEQALVAANLGMTPLNDGSVIRLPIPALTEERRKELVKKAHAMTEAHRVSIRNVRHKVKEEIDKQSKKVAKDKATLTEDEHTRALERLQKLTDSSIKKLDDALAKKEKEIMQV